METFNENNAKVDQSTSKEVAIDTSANTTPIDGRIVWYVVGIIFLIIAFVYLFKANSFMDGVAKIFGDKYDSMDKKYVGGDAYNYIIAGTYSATLTVRALFFALIGCTSIVVGKLTKKNN